MKWAGVLAVFLISTTSVLAQTHQHGSMPAGDGNFNPFVATDGRTGFYVAFIERANAASNVMIEHSPDGASFSSPVRVNDRPGDATVRNENPPKIAVAPTGEVYVCWANEREKWKGDIRFARSTDGGHSFSPAITINSDGGRKPTGHAFQSVAVDRRGRVYVAWIDERSKRPGDRGAEIWIAISDDRGRSFSRDRRIVGDVCECCRTNIQIAGDGSLFLSYRTVPPRGPMYRDIMLARSTDRGASFAASRVSEDGWEIDACPVTGPALCLGERGQAAVIWFTGGGAKPGLYYAVSTDNGKTFPSRKLLDENQKPGKHAQAVALADGKMLLAWDEADGRASILGVLDPTKGSIERLSSLDDVSYPTLAASARLVVVAGTKQSVKQIALISRPLAPAP